jgi:hypothetical protein
VWSPTGRSFLGARLVSGQKQRFTEARAAEEEQALHGSLCFLREAVAEAFNRA